MQKRKKNNNLHIYISNWMAFFRIGVKPERFNQPNHGSARTQPLGTLPYEVIATTDQYQPGQQIQGTFNCISSNCLTQLNKKTLLIFRFPCDNDSCIPIHLHTHLLRAHAAVIFIAFYEQYLWCRIKVIFILHTCTSHRMQWLLRDENISVDFSFRRVMLIPMNGLAPGKTVNIPKQYQNVHQSRIRTHATKKVQI